MIKNITKLHSFRALTFLLLGFALSGCGKDYLEEKPDKSYVVPKTITDFQQLLDNFRFFVQALTPATNQQSVDDLLITDAGLRNFSERDRASYLWDKDLQTNGTDWGNPYRQVFYCNVVLDGLKEISPMPSEQYQYNQVKGSALFLRSQAFYNLSQSFTVPYDPASAGTAPGVPLPLTSDINKRYPRGLLKDTYERILADMNESLKYLPERSSNISRPSKLAAYAFLARIYLSMQEYALAKANADQVLGSYGDLLDYNSLNLAAARAMPIALSAGNPEIIYYSLMLNTSFNVSTLVYVEPELYATYHNDDLRKSAFFINRSGLMGFRGSYSGESFAFTGLAVDEMLLIRAECLAREGNAALAITDLNALLVKRFATGKFIPAAAANAEEALKIVLLERRKELIGRAMRWSDLRRLNKDPRFAKTLKRTFDGRNYELPPNDPRYVLPIPLEEVMYHDIAQNPR